MKSEKLAERPESDECFVSRKAVNRMVADGLSLDSLLELHFNVDINDDELGDSSPISFSSLDGRGASSVFLCSEGAKASDEDLEGVIVSSFRDHATIMVKLASEPPHSTAILARLLVRREEKRASARDSASSDCGDNDVAECSMGEAGSIINPELGPEEMDAEPEKSPFELGKCTVTQPAEKLLKAVGISPDFLLQGHRETRRERWREQSDVADSGFAGRTIISVINLEIKAIGSDKETVVIVTTSAQTDTLVMLASENLEVWLQNRPSMRAHSGMNVNFKFLDVNDAGVHSDKVPLAETEEGCVKVTGEEEERPTDTTKDLTLDTFGVMEPDSLRDETRASAGDRKGAING